jgi:hypothetical protein
MDKTSTKRLFLLAIFTLFIFTGAFAQTITVGAVDPGPYGRGSSIAVPITINDASGCIAQSNVYNLYLSDALGNFAPGTLIGTYTGSYAGFINGVIPVGTPAGVGYKVRVQATTPATTSTTSAAFAISATPGVTASLASSETITGEVFGRCVGSTSSFNITPTSAGTVTASFFNEGTQAYEASNVSIPSGGYSFNPAVSNYSVTAKSVNGGVVGTYGYQLINNAVVNPFSPFGTPFVCIPAGGSGVLQFVMPITGPGGIANNYPGTTYTVNWGDGTSTTFSYCQIVALGGNLTHTYTLPSCGQTSTGGATNSLTVVSHAISPYCGELASAATTSAKVIITPTTLFTAPAVACVGTALTIPNTSNPGPDYSPGAASTCTANPNALYDWTLDGVAVVGYQGVLHSKSFVFTAAMATAGAHTLTLHSRTTAIGCQATDYTQIICFENPPQPIFTIPAQVCVTGGPVTPTNTSVIDATCGVDTYNWTVTGPAGVTYAGGTSATSQLPQFVFSTPGIYTVQLGINSGGCGLISAAVQTIRVDSAPTASLSPDVIICGNNLNFTFDPSQTITKTILTGTAQTQPTTYTWTITGGAFSFIGGTNMNSQYPKILFADFAPYTVQVTHQNACGTITKTQMITFVQAPTVDAGIDQNVCASNPATTLAGSITGSYTSYQWVGGNGTFAPNRNSLGAVYTPSNAEITAGTVTLTLQANTALPTPCNIVTDAMVINITPTAVINSPPSASVCSGQALSYTITANNPLATFAWTAAVTTGTATGFTASGTGNSITDLITNSGSVDAVVTYTIIPTIGSCPGTTFILTVTIHPLPVITAVPAHTPNCNNQAANIILTSNVANTKYTWTSTASTGTTGNADQLTPLTTSSIQDILNNSTSLAGTVTYTITPYNGTCPGTPVVATITVEPSPTASIPGPPDEICNTTVYTLQGNTPTSGTGKWTQVSGPAGATFTDDTDPHTQVNGLLAGSIYQFQWTITASASCPSSSGTVTIKVDSPPVGGTATANPTQICSGSGSQVSLTGQVGTIVQWESLVTGGSWTPVTGSANNPTLVIPSLTQTTQYRALLHNGSVCTDVYSTIATVTVNQPPTASVAGPADEICNTTVYTLQGNTPTSGTGKWTQVAGPAGITFTDDTDPHTQISGILAGNTYQFQWTITASATCPPSSSTVTIKADNPPVGGTASANPAEVCSGSGSQISLTGQVGTIVQWESLVTGGSWSPIANSANNSTLVIPSLTQTTQYRALIHNGSVCTDVYSTITTVTVDQPPTASIAGPPDEVCNTTVYTLQGNIPTSGTGKWTQVGGLAGTTFTDNTNPHTAVNGLVPGNTYQFQWTITASATCPPSSSIVTITIDSQPVGGTAAANPTAVCLGGSSQIALTGQIGTVVEWQSSIDGLSWSPISNNTTSLTTPALTQTTQYRAKLHNGVTCPDVYSTVAIVTVNQPPTASVAGPADEICNTTVYTLQGNTPTVGTGKWTQISGPAGAIFSDDTAPHATITGLTAGNTYQFQWTITASATCPPSSSSVIIKVDNPPVGGTATPNPAEVCSGSGSQVTLAGQFGTITEWQSSADGITWASIPSSANNPILQIASLTQTTKYRAKLHTSSVCTDVYSTIATVIVDQPPIAANAGQDAEICNATNYQLQANNPSPGTGKWTVLTGTGVTFANDADPNTIVNGLIPGNSYRFRWTITNSPICPSTSADVTIKDDSPPVGGTTSTPATVCSGDNTGQITLAGQSGNVVEWQSSSDGVNYTTINNAGTATTLNYAQLTQTTYYRAGIKNSGVCDEVYSTPTKITVNPVTPIANAGLSHDICNETVVTMDGNNPAPFSGMWTQASGPTVTIENPSLYNTHITGLSRGNSYSFKWTIIGMAPCPNTESTVNINAFADVIPSFAMDKTNNCGSLTVNFTNTSTPSPTGTFLWNFGDGSPTVTAINPPSHTFLPSTDGTEKTYTITMTPISNCNSQTPFTAQVTVSSSSPVAKLLPNQTSACGAFVLTAQNLSPGNNVQYDFYLKDAGGNVVQHLVKTDKSDAVFQTLNPSTPTNYTVYVVATDKCGNQSSSVPQIIQVAPSSLVSQIQIKGGIQSVCLGSPVTFQNISTGGDHFTITVYDSNHNVVIALPAGTGDLNYTPTATGVYYVSITAGNEGCGDAPESALKQFTVYPNPDPNFTYTSDKDYNVTFNNTTPNAGNIPASSLIYKWDFGDGSTNETSYIPATHRFDYSKSPFTVTLTATTPGSSCMAVTTQTINVKFLGNLFLPNAFVPAGSNNQFKIFMAKGFGLKKWHMQVFNNFGQLVWETTKLDSNGAPVEGWDGTYRGQIVEQGVYIWQISATLLNGEDWKGMSYNNSSPSRTGAIHLIR